MSRSHRRGREVRCGAGARSRSVRGLLAFAFVASALVSSGCGYRSALPGEARAAAPDSPREGGRVTLIGGAAGPEEIKTLAIVALRNDAPEPWLDRIVTDAFRRELDRRGRFLLVNDTRDADLVLRGRIRPIDTTADSFSSFIAALEYSLTIELDLEVVRSGGQIVRLDSRSLSERESYLASADIEVTRTNRLEALRRVSDVLASRVADTLELIEQPARAGSKAPASPGAAKSGEGG